MEQRRIEYVRIRFHDWNTIFFIRGWCNGRLFDIQKSKRTHIYATKQFGYRKLIWLKRVNVFTTRTTPAYH
jgi:hypothetical protein